MENIDYSIIIPAYNEEVYLLQTLKDLRKSMSCLKNLKGEIIVVDGWIRYKIHILGIKTEAIGIKCYNFNFVSHFKWVDNNSTDKTADIARENRAIVVFEPVNQISRARNKGASVSKGKYLIFIDADTLIEPKLLEKAVNNLAKGDCCGGGALIKFDSEVPSLANLFLRIWHKLNLAAGCFIYCLRETFNDIGGFNNRVYAGEEIWFSLACLKWGEKRNKKFTIIKEPGAVTSTRKFNWNSTFIILIGFLFLVLFPLATFSRSLCFLWYKRPPKKNVSN